MSPLPLDKIAHGAVSALLAFVLLFYGWPPFSAVTLVAGAGLLWEVWRGWRHPDSAQDLLADAVGILVALLLWGVR